MIADLKTYPMVKKSGVPWLGEVPAHWEVKRCRYIFREVDKRSVDGSEQHLSMSQRLGLVPSHLVENRALLSDTYAGGKLCLAGDLVLNRLKAHLGVFALARFSGVVSADYTVLRSVVTESARYFEYVLRSQACHGELRTRAKGIVEGFWRLYTDDLYDIRLPNPPLSEQAAIVRFLDHVDRRIRRYIRAKQKLIKLLEEQKQAIIHRAVTRGLDPNVHFKPSGVEWLGDVPEHWEVLRVKQCARTISKGTTPSTEGREILDHGPIRFLKAENITASRIVDSPSWFIDESTHVALRRSQLADGDVLFVIAGATLGKVALVDAGVLPANTNQAVAFIRPNKRTAPDYLALWLQSPRVGELTWLNAVQSAQPNLSMADLGSFPILLPPVQEQHEILFSLEDAFLDIDDATHHTRGEINLLREYRTRLIADVVTGKLDVREAEARLPGEVDGPEPLDRTEAEGDADEPVGDDDAEVPEETEA
jgi:type I restriction enzyme S subunit